jgi:hypothetical protein
VQRFRRRRRCQKGARLTAPRRAARRHTRAVPALARCCWPAGLDPPAPLNPSAPPRCRRYEDYYARLDVSEFASDGELRAAFKSLSLQLHPDKQAGKDPEEAAAAALRYFGVVEAFELLSDLPTRRAYDHARDKRAAAGDAGLADVGKCDRPPPTCVDVPVSLEQMYKGGKLQVWGGLESPPRGVVCVSMRRTVGPSCRCGPVLVCYASS